MSEIICDFEKVCKITRDLQTLSNMAGALTSFSVQSGRSVGHPRDALNLAAESVAKVARAEQELIDKIIDNIVADVAVYKETDEAQARELLMLGS